MMCVSDIIDVLEKMRGLSALSSSDKQRIELLYGEVLGKLFLKTSCSDCYHDALIEMIIYLRKTGDMKKKSSYTLKNGVLLQPIFGSNEMFTNDNLTDEIAEQFLSKNPEGILLFAGFPNDWQERVKPSKQGVTINEDLIGSLVESIKSGASKESIKDAYKEYQIDGKKLSNKEFGLHLKEAYAIVKANKD